MTFHSEQYHRRSIRLQGYDYAQVGAYFVTICTYQRECVFGKVVGGEVQLSAEGIIVRDVWLQTGALRPNVVLDAFVVMSNHFHGIVTVLRRGVLQYAPTKNTVQQSLHRSPSQTIGAVVRGFKGASTRLVNIQRSTPGAILWQRNYYEHILRSEQSLYQIRQYVSENPVRWAEDKENPACR